MPNPSADAGNNGAEQQGMAGVFSRMEKSYIGAGTTRRKVEQKVYYYCQETEDGAMSCQRLNPRLLPFGDATKIELDKFLATFQPEPEIYNEKTLPAMREVTKNLAKGERLRGQGQPFGAEVAFKNALSIDADNVRGNFGLGLTYLDQGKNEEAGQVLKKIVQIQDSFNPENKHMFNEFGMKLRKNGLYDQALSYYASAYKMAKDDENLCYNIARTLYDKEDYKNCKAYVEKALALKSDFKEAAGLLRAALKKLAD